MGGFKLIPQKRVKVVKLNETKLSAAIIQQMQERERQHLIEMEAARKRNLWDSISPRLKLRILQRGKHGK